MSANLSIHNVKDIEIEMSQSKISADQYYTDIIVTCTDGSKVHFDLFSKSKLEIKDINS